MATGREIVEYDIIIKAQGATQALSVLSQQAGNLDEKIVLVSSTIDKAAKKWKKSWQDVYTTFQMLDRQAQAFGQKGIFGAESGKGWALTQRFMESAEAGGRLASVANQQVKPAIDKTGDAMKKGGDAAHGFRRGIDAARIAMGTLVAMAVFRFFNFIEVSFRKAIDGARQFELALYQIQNAERSLSEAGIDITPEDFQQLITSLKELFPYLSRIDLTRMVSQVALLTKDLGLTKEQIQDLITAIPIMAQRGQITIEQATQQVVNGLANSGRGWKDLGIVVDAAVIKQEAVNAGLVKSIDAYNSLTAEQKQQVDVLALISILNKSVADETKNQADYQATLDEKLKAVSASWEDFLSLMATAGAPLLKDILDLTIKLIEGMQWFFKTVGIGSAYIISSYGAMGTALRQLLSGNIHSLQEFRKVFRETAKEIRESVMEEMNILGGIPDLGEDTPTDPLAALQRGLDSIDTSKAEEEIEKLLEDLEELDRKEKEMKADFSRKMERMEQDHQIDMRRLREDYERDRLKIIEDFNKKRKDKEDKYREKEKNDEARFQEELRQLRERFLFDLEDALRERDARQVLRLMRKYQMDKQAMINEYNLRKKDEQTQHQQDMADLEQQKRDRLAALFEEYNLRKKREEEDYRIRRQRANEEFQRDLAELRAQREAKIREAANAIAQELGIRGKGVEEIYKMLMRFYGPGGVFDGLYDYSNRSMVARAQQMLQALAQIIGMYQQVSATVGGYTPSQQQQIRSSSGGGARPAVPMAEGGTLVANQPTRVTFGEAGPELATFIPLGRSGASGGRLGASGMAGTGGGNVKIELLLSPDLEARVIENTLDRAGDIVAHVVNSKR